MSTGVGPFFGLPQVKYGLFLEFVSYSTQLKFLHLAGEGGGMVFNATFSNISHLAGNLTISGNVHM